MRKNPGKEKMIKGKKVGLSKVLFRIWQTHTNSIRIQNIKKYNFLDLKSWECGCGVPPPPPARTEVEGEGPLQPPASLALQSAPSCQQAYAAIIIHSIVYQQRQRYNTRHLLYPRQDVVLTPSTYYFH
jgi:hypothetical protein